MELWSELFSDSVGILSAAVIAFILVMAAYFAWFFITHMMRESEKKEKQQKLLVILCLLVSMCIQGVATVLVDDSHKLQSFVEQSIGPILITTCIVWCTVDARAKGEILGFGWIFGMFLLAPIILSPSATMDKPFATALILSNLFLYRLVMQKN